MERMDGHKKATLELFLRKGGFGGIIAVKPSCFRLTKTEWFNSIFRCQTIIQFMLLSRTES